MKESTNQRNRRERPVCRSGNVPNITRVVEWYYASRGGNLPPATFRLQPVWLNGITHRHVIPRERMRVEGSSRVAGFILWWFFYQRGGFLHSACAAVGMTNLRGGSVYPHRLFLRRFPERHTGRSLRFRWKVDFFNRTGCIRNVAGGRLPPLRSCTLFLHFTGTNQQ